MAFTYDLTETGDDLAVSQIRLEIGDTDDSTDAGVKPDGTNFTDAELLYFYEQETNNVPAAAARACEVLARMWAGAGESVRVRDYQIDTTKKAEHYRSMAAALRERIAVSAVGTLDREDAYS